MFKGIGVARVGHIRPFTITRKVNGVDTQVTAVEISGYVNRPYKTASGEAISDKFKMVEFDPTSAANLIKNFAKLDASGQFERNQDGSIKSSGRNIMVDARPEVDEYEFKHKVNLTVAQLQAALQYAQTRNLTEVPLELPVKARSVVYNIQNWSFVDAPKSNNAPLVNNAPAVRFSFENGAANTAGAPAPAANPGLGLPGQPVATNAPIVAAPVVQNPVLVGANQGQLTVNDEDCPW